MPENIAPEDIKRDFLKMRKNLMIRLIHSELRNKKISEWTFKSLNRIQKNQMLSAETRPPSVLKYNKLKEQALLRARFNQPADTSVNFWGLSAPIKNLQCMPPFIYKVF